MYRLQVFRPGDATPVETRALARAADVLSLIPELLAAHPECEKVVVLSGSTRLFAVDCKGNRLSD